MLGWILYRREHRLLPVFQVEKGAELENGSCPQSNERFWSFGKSDDKFIKATERYVIIQVSLGAIQLLLGYLLVMSYNVVAENQVDTATSKSYPDHG